MKFIDVDNANNLRLSDTATPRIKPDECLIKVRAIGVNRADILQRQGKYPAPPGESDILGLEVAGDLVELGTKVCHWQLKDKVFGLVPGGGYAEFAIVKAAHLFHLPDTFSYTQGAAVAEVFLTAYQSLFSIARLSANERVLVHAGASGVGSAVIQLASSMQCQVTATVGSAQKVQACLALGCDQVINYKQQDFVQWQKSHAPQGFDVIIDPVGGPYLNKDLAVAAQDARIVLLAMLGGRYSDKLDIAKLLHKRINLTASTLRNRSDKYKAKLVSDFSEQFLAQLVSGQIKPVIDSVYAWQDADQAHQKMLSNLNIGKLILTVNG